MTVLTAMQSAAIRLLGQKPGTFFGATNQFEVELTDLVNEVATDISKYQDWQALVRFAVVAGDGTETDFSLPDDYDRMLQNAEVQDSTAWAWGYRRVNDLNTFTYLVNTGWGPYPGVWTLYANLLRFTPAPATATTATYPYITIDIVKDAGSLAGKPQFTSDTDTFLLPERLLTLGLVWRWRENKKLDASGDQEAFIKALDEYAVKDRGSRAYRRNGGARVPGTHTAWPWPLGGA